MGRGEGGCRREALPLLVHRLSSRVSWSTFRFLHSDVKALLVTIVVDSEIKNYIVRVWILKKCVIV